MALLSLRSDTVAALLRNPQDSYPSGQLVRLMLAQRQDPAERFAHLVSIRLQEVEAQLEQGVQALRIGQELAGLYRVQPKEHLITVLSGADLAGAELRSPDELATVAIASLAIPFDWVHRCRICQSPFVARNSRQQVCRKPDERGRFPCVRQAERERRQARKEATCPR
jgi:hypothetical protein